MSLRRSKGLKRSPLKKGDSQMKRTPLSRGDYKLQSSSRLVQKKPLAWRSEKTKRVYEERRKLVESELINRPWCEACNAFRTYDGTYTKTPNASEHLHEIVLRSQGGDILDASIIVVVCADCHNRVDEEPNAAEMLGLYLRSFMYDDEHTTEASRVRDLWSQGIPTTPYYLKE